MIIISYLVRSSPQGFGLSLPVNRHALIFDVTYTIYRNGSNSEISLLFIKGILHSGSRQSDIACQGTLMTLH